MVCRVFLRFNDVDFTDAAAEFPAVFFADVALRQFL